MNKIYTRSGDRGTTGIHGGERVDKDDPRIEANGTLDELNCQLGAVRSLLPPQDAWHEPLHRIQSELMAAMSHVATPSAARENNANPLDPDLVAACEQWIDRLMEETPRLNGFVLPGGTPLAAQLQLARAVARRAERRLWTLHRIDPVPDPILKLANRLSDLLFAMARAAMQRSHTAEQTWQSLAHKRRRNG